MSKNLKFTLYGNCKPIRKLEDLQDNFNAADMLEIYKSRILHKWLESRDFKSTLDALNKIKATTDKEIVKALAELFNVNLEDEEQDVR